MKLICDFSFINDYIEKFYSNTDRRSASIVNSAISPFLEGDALLVISHSLIEELRLLYGEDRKLVLDSIFGICDKSDIDLGNRMDNLIKLVALAEVEDEKSYVLAEDDYVIGLINRTTHKAVSVDEAISLLKEEGLLKENKTLEQNE